MTRGSGASLTSGRTPVLFGNMALEVAAIVKNAENVDHAQTIAATVDDEVPGILYNPKSTASPFFAEAQMICSDALL